MYTYELMCTNNINKMGSKFQSWFGQIRLVSSNLIITWCPYAIGLKLILIFSVMNEMVFLIENNHDKVNINSATVYSAFSKRY